MPRSAILEAVVRLGKPERVDRDKGILFNVKILGLESENSRRYLPEAVAAAVRLYEGMAVNVDHPRKANDPRRAHDRFGWFENVRVAPEGGLRGDFHLLDPTEPLAVKVMNAAANKPDLFGFSHNAEGDGHTDAAGVFIVEQIVAVRSVDLVAEPATTGGLFEGVGANLNEAGGPADRSAAAKKGWETRKRGGGTTPQYEGAAAKAHGQSEKAHTLSSTLATDSVKIRSKHGLPASGAAHDLSDRAVDHSVGANHAQAAADHERAANEHEASANSHRGGWFSKGDKAKQAAHQAAAAAHRKAADLHAGAHIHAGGKVERSIQSYESRRLFMNATLHQFLDTVAAKAKGSKGSKRFIQFVEGLDDEMPLLDTEMDAPAEGGDWKADLTAAIGKLTSGEDAASHDLALKILKMLRPDKAAADEAPLVEEEDEEEELEEECETPPDKKKTEEGRKPRKTSPAVRQLQEQVAKLTADKDLAELKAWLREEVGRHGLPFTEKLQEGLLLLKDRKAITAHLAEVKKLHTPRQLPRSQSPTGPRNIPEGVSKEPTTGKEFAVALREMASAN